jgi:gluconolactonase
MSQYSRIAPGTIPERVFDGGFYTEGPAEGPDGCIYFCDITPTFRTGMAAGNLWAFDPRRGHSRIVRSPSGMASGIQFDALGRMVVAAGADFGARAIIRTDMASGRSHYLAAHYNQRPLNSPNDLVIDSAGRIYFTDPRYFGHEPIEQPVFGVYRIDPDGRLSLLLADVSKPNGIALSPDEKTLYVVEHDIRILDRRIDSVPVRDSGDMRILAYELVDGRPRKQTVLVDFGPEKGADGITVDGSGNVYAAVQSPQNPGVRIYSAAGQQLDALEMPVPPSNLTLVNHDGRVCLYITAGGSLYRVATQARAILPLFRR